MKTIFILFCSIISCFGQAFTWHDLALVESQNAGASFQPSDVAGLIMWYDANAIGSPTNVNGYLVTNWYDRSVSGYTLRNTGLNPSGGPYQPYFTNDASVLGGKPWLNFGPTNYLLHFNTTKYSQSNVLFMVAKGGNSALTEQPIDGTNAVTRLAILIGASPKTITFYSGNTLALNPVVANKWYLYECTATNGGSSVFTNGVLMGTGNAGTHPLSGLVLGCRYSLDQNFLLGGIAEVIIYNGPVASGDLVKIRTYFTDKYGPYANW